MAGPEHAIVRVLRNGRGVGLAFHVGGGRLLTCAHVVNAALGRAAKDVSDPGEVALPAHAVLREGSSLDVSLVGWSPAGPDTFDERDVAVLAVMGTTPSWLGTVTLARTETTSGTDEVQAIGPSPDRHTPAHVRGHLLGAVDGSRLQVNQRIEGIFRMRAGFSGGPVWQIRTGMVVGALQAVAVDDEATDAYVVSAPVLAEALAGPAARVGRPAVRPAEVCALHLANPRFKASGGIDAALMLDDLHRMRDHHGITPDVVTVAGNLADAALPKEYEAAYGFLGALTHGLDLPRDRVVVVPGTSDVNRFKCQAYFLNCEGEGERPLWPYWPKWEPFASFLERFHGRPFPKDEPWSFATFPELNLVVAGVNSTMAESHERPDAPDRPGGPGGTDGSERIGRDQANWFVERLRHARHDGLLRLVVVNDVRDLGTDDHAGTRIAAAAHAVIDGSPDTVGDGGLDVPVLRAGDRDRYRLARFTADGVTMWARRFDHGRNRWTGDTNVSLDGDTWSRRIPVRWSDAASAFPPVNTPVDTCADAEVDPLVDATLDPTRLAQKALLERVYHAEDGWGRLVEVLRHREPDATVERAGDKDTGPYLRVSRSRSIDPQRPGVIETFPIGLVSGDVSEPAIDAFVRNVDARFRLGGPAVGSKLVYEGAPAERQLVERARLKGVELLSFAEFQLGYDLRPYAAWQADELSRDQLYPSALYIPQRYTGLGATTVHDDLLDDIRRWLADPDGQFALVLGPFGHGKTFLLRELARRMHANGDPAIPVLVYLRDLEKTHQLDQLVAAQLTQGGPRRVDVALFRYLLREGRVALLFDGYDELALRVTYQRATDHLNTIIQAAEGKAKVVLTSRDNYFLTDGALTSALGDRLAVIAGRRIVRLQGFADDQIRAFLTRRLGDPEAAERRLALLHDVRDLLGLSRNPRMLSFIGQIDEARLLAARDKAGEITAAGLYRELIDQWIGYEWRRLGEPDSPSRAAIWSAVSDLAVRMWHAPGERLGLADLQETAETLHALTPTPGETGPTPDETSHLLGSSTLLVRDGSGTFRFVHRSILEWLVARECARRIGDGARRPEPLARATSPLMVDFLVDLAGRERVTEWARAILAGEPDASPMSENAEKVLKRLGESARGARLARQDLRGRDLTRADLRDADLSEADLTEATLVEADLTGATLRGATLHRVRLDRAQLVGADLSQADLTDASLVGANLADADLAGTILHRANLLRATIDDRRLADADVTGAARDVDAAARQMLPTPSALGALAISPDGVLIATGSDLGHLTILNRSSYAPIRVLSGPRDAVSALDWSPDGRLLAVAGGRGSIHLWDAASGEIIGRLEGHRGVVSAVAFAPDAATVAACGSSGVSLWDVKSRRPVRRTVDPVIGVAWTSGSTLMLGRTDGTLQMLDIATGGIDTVDNRASVHAAFAYSAPTGRAAWGTRNGEVSITTDTSTTTLPLQLGSVHALTWSPDGATLAVMANDGQALIGTDGSITVHELAGKATIRAIRWTPDGSTLVGCGFAAQVTTWDAATGKPFPLYMSGMAVTLAVEPEPGGNTIAVVRSGQSLRTFDVDTMAMRAFDVPAAPAVALQWSRDGSYLAAACNDGSIHCFDGKTGRTVRVLTDAGSPPRAVAWGPDNWIASVGDDDVLRVWPRKSVGGPAIRLKDPGTGRLKTVDWSPRRPLVATASTHGPVRVWDVATHTVHREFDTGDEGVTSVRWSPDGTMLAGAGLQGTVKLWRSDSGQTAGSVKVGFYPRAVAWSPDGRRLACACESGLFVADVGTARREHVASGQPFWSVNWLRSGRGIVAGTLHGTVLIWVADRDGRFDGDPVVELVPLADGGLAALGDGWHKVSGTVKGEVWWAINQRRFEFDELTAERTGVTEVPLAAPLPIQWARPHSATGMVG